ncbi:hypothetical protein GCM10023203_38040 [Actinomycetospora straminea]|uniref:Uncharacterized protein n=1 Tax=Actinomycetospora straminea TaxID=663607 RepID=A0ABP9EN37_9PSEU
MLSYQAWKRPVPPDPTQIPTFPIPGQSDLISDASQARALIAFIQQHEGRKIRIRVKLDPSYYTSRSSMDTPTESGLLVPTQDCPVRPLSELTTQDCNLEALEIQGVSPDRHGLVYAHGNWSLDGYFASSGFINTFTGLNAYSIYPLTPVEAVS